MSKKKIAYQQGDVILFEEEIPEGGRKLSSDEHQNVLRRGEVTGHAHRVDGFMKAYRKSQGSGEPEFMGAPRRIVLRHEEHAGAEGQEVEARGYLVSGVREVDHITNELRRVAD